MMKDFFVKRKNLTVTLLSLFVLLVISFPLIYYKRIKDATPFDIVVANVTTSSAEIYWKSKAKNIQSLSYREKNSTTPYKEVNNPTQRNDLSTHSNLYIQKIENLLPEKTYVFRIRYKNNKTEKEVTFKTAKVDNTLTFPTIEAGDGPKETFVLISMDEENIIVDTQDHGTWAFDSKGKEYSTSNYATYATEKSLGEKLKELLRVKNIYLLTAYADEGNWWSQAPDCKKYDDNQVTTINIFDKQTVHKLMDNTIYSTCGSSHYGSICYTDVICRSLDKRVDPGIVFAIWQQESNGSNFQGYHATKPNGEMPWHFGINDTSIPSFSDQLDRLLVNLKDGKNSYANAETMVDFALIFSGVGIDDKAKVFMSELNYLLGKAADGSESYGIGFKDALIANKFSAQIGEATEQLEAERTYLLSILDETNKGLSCKKILEKVLNDQNPPIAGLCKEEIEGIQESVTNFKKASKYLMYLRANYSENVSSIKDFDSFTINTALGGKTCTRDHNNNLTFSYLTQQQTRTQCVKALACIADSGDNFYAYNTYAYNLALNYCQLTGKNLFDLKYPGKSTKAVDNNPCKGLDSTTNTTVAPCESSGTTGGISGGSSGSSSGGSSSGTTQVVGNTGGNRPPTPSINTNPPSSQPGDPNNNPDLDEMVVNNENRYCTNKNGCICIYNYQKPDEKRIEIKNGQKCTTNQEVQEIKKVCCQVANEGLYTVDEYSCTGTNIIRNDRNGSTCDSKTISYNFRPGYNIIQMQEIHNKTDVPLTTAKTFIDISEKSVITISKFANNRWGDTIILKDGNIHGADFDIKQGEVYLVTSKNNLRLDTLGIKVIPSSNIPTAQGWSLIPTNDLQAGLTTHQIYKIDKYKNIEQVALLDNIRNSFIYTIKDEKGELIGEDTSLSNYDAVFLKLKANNP